MLRPTLLPLRSEVPAYDPILLLPEQRKHQSNGIWLCQVHAKAIDSDSNHFTVETLRKWKGDAEAESFRAIMVSVASGQRIEYTTIETADQQLVERLGLAAEGDLRSILPHMIGAAQTDLEAFKRMPGWPTHAIPLNLRMTDGDAERAFTAPALAGAINAFNEIVVIAPPGHGKTTTLVQVTEAILSEGHSVAVFIPLNEWSTQPGGFFQTIVRRHAFTGIREEHLKLLAHYGRLVLVIDGWNEIVGDARCRARNEVAALRREFPDLGIVVSTRRQALDVPISGTRLEIDKLTGPQQLQIARTLRGSDGEKILDQAWRTAGIDELVAIPLYLTVLLSQTVGPIFPTTKEQVLRLFVRQLERGKDDGESLRRAIFDCHTNVLTAVAMEATQSDKTLIPENRARQVIKKTAEQLSAQGQIATVPEPMTVLDVLVNHHLLVRSASDVRDISFQHQQFQEWYASFEVEMVMRGTAMKKPENA